MKCRKGFIKFSGVEPWCRFISKCTSTKFPPNLIKHTGVKQRIMKSALSKKGKSK